MASDTEKNNDIVTHLPSPENPSRREFIKAFPILMATATHSLSFAGEVQALARPSFESRMRQLREKMSRFVNLENKTFRLWFGNHILTEDYERAINDERITMIFMESRPLDPLFNSFSGGSDNDRNMDGLGLGATGSSVRTHERIRNDFIQKGGTFVTIDGEVPTPNEYPYLSLGTTIGGVAVGVITARYRNLFSKALFRFGGRQEKESEGKSSHNWLPSRRNFMETLFVLTTGLHPLLERIIVAKQNPIDVEFPFYSEINAIKSAWERIQRTLLGIESDHIAPLRERLVHLRNLVMTQNSYHVLSHLPPYQEENIGQIAGNGHGQTEELLEQGPRESANQIRSYINSFLDPGSMKNDFNAYREVNQGNAQMETSVESYVRLYLAVGLMKHLEVFAPAFFHRKDVDLSKINYPDGTGFIPSALELAHDAITALARSSTDSQVREIYQELAGQLLNYWMYVYKKREQKVADSTIDGEASYYFDQYGFPSVTLNYVQSDELLSSMRNNVKYFEGPYVYNTQISNPVREYEYREAVVGRIVIDGETMFVVRKEVYRNGQWDSTSEYTFTGLGYLLGINYASASNERG